MPLRTLATASLALAAIIGGCTPAASRAPTAGPTVAAPATSAPGAAATVEAKSVGTIGTVLVAGSNGMTVYVFTKDTKDSGTSACLDTCATNWPPLSVAAGGAPVAGTGVAGKLGTITRPDGTLQVTYNGKPLYFFANDKAPGDANGVYTNWEAVKP